MSDQLEIMRGIARLEANQNSMKEDIAEIKTTDIRQNQLLAEHIAGVKGNRESIEIEKQARQEALTHYTSESLKRHKVIDDRLKSVEFVPNLLRGIGTLVKWLGGISAGGLAITKFLGMW